MWSLDDGAPPLWRDRAASPHTMAFTTRRGGVSEAPYDQLNVGRSTGDLPEAVEANRRRVLEALGLDPARFATAGQVHGADLAEVTAPGLQPRTDALLTRVPGLALAVTAADCVPLLLAAPGVACAVHAGWRGVAAGLPAAAARVTAAATGEPGALTVHVGPSIRACCYEVGDEVAARFPSAALARAAGGAWRLDLVAGIRLQLHEAGVPDSRIHVVPACTACDPRNYFSHRRDAGRTGRQWGVVALPAPPADGARV